jgi:GNAT superfamily N-acetyltransferase
MPEIVSAEPQFRLARHAEAELLTSISFQSKKHWNYPLHYFEVWQDELTITPSYIKNNDVFVIEDATGVFGYFSIVQLKNDLQVGNITLQKGHWLEHMFLLPEYIGKGYGTKLFAWLKKTCRDKAIHVLHILADPHARGFYEKMGWPVRERISLNYRKPDNSLPDALSIKDKDVIFWPDTDDVLEKNKKS